jgi:hypothetical protein
VSRRRGVLGLGSLFVTGTVTSPKGTGAGASR